jgi:hypothetical protein
MFEQICQMKMSVNHWNLMKRKWISLVCFFLYCEVSNIHHPLWSCQIEVRSKGILVVSLIAFVMCERVDKNGHALTYTIVHWKSKIEQIMYIETDIQWSNEQIFPYGCYDVYCIAALIIRAKEVEKMLIIISSFDVCLSTLLS